MLVKNLALKGLCLLEFTSIEDNRGSFMRIFCEDTLTKAGIDFPVRQSNISRNIKKGTLRGLHYQKAPFEEAKIIQCIRGAIFDVLVDIRENSPTFGQWFSLNLSEDKPQAILVPGGFAHGFQTLTDHSEILYLMSNVYHGPSASGIHWNDPNLGILWPEIPERIISEKDQALPLLANANLR